jgi:hypothetical protein
MNMMTMVRMFVVLVVAFVAAGCGSGTTLVESRCDSQLEYRIYIRDSDVQQGLSLLGLHLEIGPLAYKDACSNSLGSRLNSAHFDTSVLSLDEAHQIIEDEVARYQQAHSSER